MLRHGDGAKEIWLTEFGWSTSIASYGVTEAQQGSYLERALAELDRYPYVTKAFYYGFRNVYWLRDDPRSLQAGYGLVRGDFTPKPAFEVFRRYATGVRPAPVAAAAVKPKRKAAPPPRKLRRGGP
jgi:hypothetical protein